MAPRVENNDKTPGGVTGKGFGKGKSGNPGGRPKGIAHAREYLEANTAGGEELIDFHLKLMRGQLRLTMFDSEGEELTRVPDFKDMQHSADWLADRLWGKSVQAVEHTGADGEALSIQIIRKVAK